MLADVMRSEVKVIESKRHDARSGEERKQAWKNVVNAYNARSAEKRDEKQLSQLWRDMKKVAKKDHSRFKRQRMGAGGGPQPDPLDPLTQEVKDMIQQVFEPITGVMDYDEEMEHVEPGDYDFEFSLFLYFLECLLDAERPHFPL